jgi:hypothetical protein
MGNGKLWDDVRKRIEKTKRKFVEIDYRRAELFCIGCDKSLGIHDVVYDSVDALKYCMDCAKKFIKPMPIQLTDDISVVYDMGTSVTVWYGDPYKNAGCEQVIKQCYFSSKGRFINIHSKRYYL